MLKILLCSLLLIACGITKPPFDYQLQGNTMGTQYHVRLPSMVGDDANIKLSRQELTQLQQDIDALLLTVNQEMSTYLPDSSLSRFNRLQSTHWFPISNNFLNVIQNAQAISQASKGAFDVTVMPLVNLWGFGISNIKRIPSQQQITQNLKKVGYQSLQIQPQPAAIRKKIADLTLDFSAIAKGYAVDALALLLDQRGIKHYLVEIGGEIRVRGNNKKNKLWRIAIEKPTTFNRSLQQGIRLDNIAIATSGDYRNYYEKEGKRYSHTINPKTGQPIRHKLASVTVIHESTMIADAQATTMMVLGEEKGKIYAQQQGLSVYMIIREDAGFTVWHNLSEYVLVN